jgi:Tat protein translocase TatB subunit
MSFGELVILGVIAIVVVGPRRLPALLRSAGQLIGQLRRMAVDVRKESGIDQLLEAEGINKEIDTFRRLAAGDVASDALPSPPTEQTQKPGDTWTEDHGATADRPDPYAPTGEAALQPPKTATPAPQPQMAAAAQPQPHSVPPPPPHSVPPTAPKIARPLPGLPHPTESLKPK